LNKNQQNVLKYILKKIEKPKSLSTDELSKILSDAIGNTDIPNTWSKNDSNLMIKNFSKAMKKYDK